MDMDDPDLCQKPLLFLGRFRFLRLPRLQPFPLPPRKTGILQFRFPIKALR
jgi:uncharacterized protein YwqG